MRISDWSSDVCSSDLCRWQVGTERVDLRSLVFPQFQLIVDGGSTALLDDGIDLVNGDFVRPFRASNELGGGRSEERRGGKECVSTGRTWWSRDHYKKKSESQALDYKLATYSSQ